MKKRFHRIWKKRHPSHPSNVSSPVKYKPRRVPLSQAIAMPVVSLLVFFLLLEGVLALFGVKPVLISEDPFVGFASNAPLFSAVPGTPGNRMLATSPNKLHYFNEQAFPSKKAPGTYRIFSLGGSTTFGRPYDDNTSFSGWLRQLLPAADAHKKWEVINAGGISYASYRVAHLMEELIRYRPDLFIVYTGHNEFLEDRTYGEIRDMAPMVMTAASLLNKTRTWAAMSSVMRSLGIQPQQEEAERHIMSSRVDTILDHSAGPDKYTRDDALRENVLEHFRLSLERMIALARSVDARVILVTPASSLKDCAPFKSQHTPGLEPSTRKHVEQMLAKIKEAMQEENWQTALNMLEAASAEDPRHAELQYRRGQTLLALGRFDEANTAFRIARDEDICPLRALTPMRRIVAEMARDQDAWLVDYVDILERHRQAAKGDTILGEELFLDHVHPTIEGHKILALALIEKMIKQNLLQPGADWNEHKITEVSARIEENIDRESHGRALANLAQVLLWAGKNEDAVRIARRAEETTGDITQVAPILSIYYLSKGQFERSMEVLYRALESAPAAIEVHLRLAENYMFPQLLQLEKAAAKFLLFSHFMPSYDRAHEMIGYIMARRGRLDIAYARMREALRLNPNNTQARENLSEIRKALGARISYSKPAQILLDFYPSQAPLALAQVRTGSDGHPVVDGIKAKFHENGRIKYFADVLHGKLNGFEIKWDSEGRLLSRKEYRNGVPVNAGSGL